MFTPTSRSAILHRPFCKCCQMENVHSGTMENVHSGTIDVWFLLYKDFPTEWSLSGPFCIWDLATKTCSLKNRKRKEIPQHNLQFISETGFHQSSGYLIVFFLELDVLSITSEQAYALYQLKADVSVNCFYFMPVEIIYLHNCICTALENFLWINTYSRSIFNNSSATQFAFTTAIRETSGC